MLIHKSIMYNEQNSEETIHIVSGLPIFRDVTFGLNVWLDLSRKATTKSLGSL